MNCMPSLERADIRGMPLPDLELPGLLDQRARNRQSAVACLQAAAKTDDAMERNRLRLQAAELILPRRLVAAGF